MPDVAVLGNSPRSSEAASRAEFAALKTSGFFLQSFNNGR